MPTDTILVLGGVLAAFVFFACVLTFADMTWSRPARRRHVRRLGRG
jgi:hypothetical protein